MSVEIALNVTTLLVTSGVTPADIATETGLTGAAIDGIAASVAAAAILVVGIVILFLIFSKRST